MSNFIRSSSQVPLPAELFHFTLSYLTPEEAARVSPTSTDVNRIVNHLFKKEGYWEKCVRAKDSPFAFPKEREISWQVTYMALRNRSTTWNLFKKMVNTEKEKAKGHANLAKFYREIQPLHPKAREHFQEALKLREPRAIYSHAVELVTPSDFGTLSPTYQEGIQFLETLHAEGYVPASEHLGMMYLFGNEVVQVDEEKAIALLRTCPKDIRKDLLFQVAELYKKNELKKETIEETCQQIGNCS